MAKLSELPNVGAELEKQLNEAGITTSEELAQTGSKQAWLMIQGFDPSACYNRLCGLEGAIRGVRWHYLDDETKRGLKEFYNTYKIEGIFKRKKTKT